MEVKFTGSAESYKPLYYVGSELMRRFPILINFKLQVIMVLYLEKHGRSIAKRFPRYSTTMREAVTPQEVATMFLQWRTCVSAVILEDKRVHTLEVETLCLIVEILAGITEACSIPRQRAFAATGV